MIYEAENSQKARVFLADNPNKNRALMFYDIIQEDSNAQLEAQVDRVMTLFVTSNYEGWTSTKKEDLNIMRIDVSKGANKEIVQEYKVQSTPYLVLLFNGNPIFQEIVDENTDDHVKDVLFKYPRQVSNNGVISQHLGNLNRGGYRPNYRPWAASGRYVAGSSNNFPSYLNSPGAQSSSTTMYPQTSNTNYGGPISVTNARSISYSPPGHFSSYPFTKASERDNPLPKGSPAVRPAASTVSHSATSTDSSKPNNESNPGSTNSACESQFGFKFYVSQIQVFNFLFPDQPRKYRFLSLNNPLLV